MAGRRKKRRTQGKYILRRFLLTLIVLVLVGGAGWLIWGKLEVPAGEAEPSQEAVPPVSGSSIPSETKPSEEESEPEPEPEPVTLSGEDEWQLILASAVSPLPTGYAPPQLETVAPGYQVDSRIAPALNTMIAEAKIEGISLMICSAYRSEERQKELHQNKIAEHRAAGKSEEEAIAVAASIVLPPGTSEHQTGLAVDIVTPENQNLNESFAQTPAAKWMAENSWKYGFILRYPKDKQEITNIIYEPWHFRYVGEEHAEAIYQGGYCLEEYLYGVLNQKRLGSFVIAPDANQLNEEEPARSGVETKEKEQ